MRDVVARYRPDYVFHLAAATPPAAEDAYLSTNVAAPSSCSRQSPLSSRPPRVVVVGSDAQYGPQPPTCLPTRESARMAPGRRLRAIQTAAGIDRALVLAHPWLARLFVSEPSITSARTVRAVVVGSLARQVALAELAARRLLRSVEWIGSRLHRRTRHCLGICAGIGERALGRRLQRWHGPRVHHS